MTGDRSTIFAALGVAGLASLCCGGPLLIGGLSVLGASVLLGRATYLILPSAILLAVVAGLAFFARFGWAKASGKPCRDGSGKPARILR